MIRISSTSKQSDFWRIAKSQPTRWPLVWKSACGLLLPLILAAAAAAVPVEVQPLDGAPLSGRLIDVSTEQIAVETAEGRRELARNELLRVESSYQPAASSRAIQVELVDGSLLAAASYAVQSGRVAIELLGGGRLRTTTRTIRAVRLLPRETALEGAWQSIRDDPSSGDVIVIRKTSPANEAEGLGGPTIVLDQLEGILGDVDSSSVGFEFDKMAVNVPRPKVEGIVYHHAQTRRVSEPVCELRDLAGSRWVVRTIQMEDEALLLTTTAGVRGKVPLDQLAALDYGVGNLAYLSDLPVESSDYRPHVVSSLTPQSVARWFRPRTGQRPLSLDDEVFERGITLHSRSSLTYRLRSDYKRLRAKVGIDDRFRNKGRVRLQITGNNRILFDQEIIGTDDPLELDLDVQGVRRLTILVDFGEDGNDLGDHLNLCNARLTK